MNPLILYGRARRPKALGRRGDVCYAGFDYRVRRRLIDGGVNLLDISEAIEESSRELKFEFIDYIASTGRRQRHEVLWWSSKIASKSNLQTDFFSVVALLEAVTKMVDREGCRFLLVSDPRVFFALLGRYPGSAPMSSRVRACCAYGLTLLRSLLLFLPARVYLLLRLLYRNGTFRRYTREAPGRAVYIYSWLEERSFGGERSYEDPYLGDMLRFTDGKGVLFIPYYGKPSLYARLRSAGLRFTGLPCYSRISFIVRSLLVVNRVRRDPVFKGLDLTCLWRVEVFRENCGHSGQRFHEYLCWKEFFQQAGGTLVYPYEGQPWEKVMILAASAVRNRWRLIGYQHSSIGKMQLNYHTTPNEAETMPLPDTIVVNSASALELLRIYYEPSGPKVVDGGALRYRARPLLKRVERQRKKLGVMMPSERDQTYTLFYDVKRDSPGRFDIAIKPHPDLPIEEAMPENMEVFSGPAFDFYARVDGVVYSSSTVGLEAFSYGLPVFRYRGAFIDLQMGENGFHPRTIRSIREITEDDLRPGEPREVFTPPREDLWRSLLAMAERGSQETEVKP